MHADISVSLNYSTLSNNIFFHPLSVEDQQTQITLLLALKDPAAFFILFAMLIPNDQSMAPISSFHLVTVMVMFKVDVDSQNKDSSPWLI